MFSPEEYEYYNKQADHALNGEVVLDPPGCPVDDMFPVAYYHNGDDATFDDFTNVVIYGDQYSNLNYHIDIFSDVVIIEYGGKDNDLFGSYKFSTELFNTESDEEFFQLGTVLDLFFMEETLLRKFIKLSLMARTNLNNRES